MLQKLKNFLFHNTTAKQTVAKNTFWLTVSNFGGRAIKAIVVVYAARVLGTAGYGVFSYAVTLAGFFTLFVDPGVNALLTREVPKADDSEKRKLLSTTLVMKGIFTLIGVLFVLFVAPIFSTLPGAQVLLPIVALIIIVDTFREHLSAFMRAREKMEWETGVFLLTNVGILIAGFIFLSITKTPSALSWAYVVGTVLGALLAVWLVRDYLKDIFSYFSSKLVLPILRSAWPFAVTGVLGLLLTSTDILIISWMRTASDVGVYSAAIRIIQVLYIIPMIFQYSTLPLIARLANKDNERFRSVFERTVSLVFLASVPLALGGIVLGTPIMGLIFGSSYEIGGTAFRILMLTMLFDFPLAIIATAIFVYDRQKNLIVSTAIGGVTNIALDLLLIPRYGISGSAVATLIAQAATSWYLWHTMKKINFFSVFPRLGKVLVAGVLMAIMAIILFSLGLNVLINIAISGALYFALLYLFKEPMLMEVKNVLVPVPA